MICTFLSVGLIACGSSDDGHSASKNKPLNKTNENNREGYWTNDMKNLGISPEKFRIAFNENSKLKDDYHFDEVDAFSVRIFGEGAARYSYSLSPKIDINCNYNRITDTCMNIAINFKGSMSEEEYRNFVVVSTSAIIAIQSLTQTGNTNEVENKKFIQELFQEAKDKRPRITSKDIGSIQYAAMAKSSDKLVTGDDYLYLVIDLK